MACLRINVRESSDHDSFATINPFFMLLLREMSVFVSPTVFAGS